MHKGAKVDIIRGKHAGQAGVVKLASTEQPGFWWVEPYMKTGALGMAVLLSEGQLQLQEGGQSNA